VIDHEKATYEDLDHEHFARLQRFLNLSFTELQKIDDFWAVGDIVEQLENPNLHPEVGKYVFMSISPQAVIDVAELLGLPVGTLFNDDVSDFRFVTTLERWERGLPVDPPTVSIGSKPGTLSISDGRHRLILANFINKKSIPIAVLISQAEIISGLLGVQCPHF